MSFYWFFGLFQSNHIIPHPWGSWDCHQPLTFLLPLLWAYHQPLTFLLPLLWAYCDPFSLFHIIYCPWFAFFFFLSFQAPISPFTLSRPICLSYESVIHYFYHLGLMSFLSIYQIFSVCVVGLFLFTWTSKMAINNVID